MEGKRAQADSGPAFPVSGTDGVWSSGMSLRDYAAIEAMSSLIASGQIPRGQCHRIANEAYAQADAMLEEREKSR